MNCTGFSGRAWPSATTKSVNLSATPCTAKYASVVDIVVLSVCFSVGGERREGNESTFVLFFLSCECVSEQHWSWSCVAGSRRQEAGGRGRGRGRRG
jgi:hypothetical protein